LEIERRAGEAHARISAEEGEYSALFSEEVKRLRTVLNTNGGMDQYEMKMREIGEYFSD